MDDAEEADDEQHADQADERQRQARRWRRGAVAGRTGASVRRTRAQCRGPGRPPGSTFGQALAAARRSRRRCGASRRATSCRRLGRERLDALRDGLGLEHLEVARVVAVVEEQQVRLVGVGVLEAQRLPVGEVGVGLRRVDHVEAPALEVEQLRRVLGHGDGVVVVVRADGERGQARLRLGRGGERVAGRLEARLGLGGRRRRPRRRRARAARSLVALDEIDDRVALRRGRRWARAPRSSCCCSSTPPSMPL